jgi:hypothetical protein
MYKMGCIYILKSSTKRENGFKFRGGGQFRIKVSKFLPFPEPS